MLGVGDVADAVAAPCDAVADGVAGVDQRCRFYRQAGMQREIVSGDKIVERHLGLGRDIQAGHEGFAQAGQHRLLDAVRRGQVAAPEPQPGARIEQGLKERQPADMVEMGVAEQKIGLHVLAGGRKFVAQFPQTAAGIEDQQMRAASQFHAQRVAAVTHCARSGGRHAAAHAPEADRHRVGSHARRSFQAVIVERL